MNVVNAKAKQQWEDLNASDPNPFEIDRALANLPKDAFDLIVNQIIPEIQSGRKIQAIKALRTATNTSLRTAKHICDEIQIMDQHNIKIADAEEKLSNDETKAVIKYVGKMEDSCREALSIILAEKNSFDPEVQRTLAGMRTQLSSLWDKLSGCYDEPTLGNVLKTVLEGRK